MASNVAGPLCRIAGKWNRAMADIWSRDWLSQRVELSCVLCWLVCRGFSADAGWQGRKRLGKEGRGPMIRGIISHLEERKAAAGGGPSEFLSSTLAAIPNTIPSPLSTLGAEIQQGHCCNSEHSHHLSALAARPSNCWPRPTASASPSPPDAHERLHCSHSPPPYSQATAPPSSCSACRSPAVAKLQIGEPHPLQPSMTVSAAA